MTLIAISHYIEAKFDYGYFIILFALWFLDFTQKNDKIAVVKYYLYIVEIAIKVT